MAGSSSAIPIWTQPTAVVPSTASALLVLKVVGVSSGWKAATGLGSGVVPGIAEASVAEVADAGAVGVEGAAPPEGTLAFAQALLTSARTTRMTTRGRLIPITLLPGLRRCFTIVSLNRSRGPR